MTSRRHLLRRIDRLASEFEANWNRLGLDQDTAHGAVVALDRCADVLERNPDEPYVDHYDDELYEVEPDEPYMDHFEDDVLEQDADEQYMDHFAGEVDMSRYMRKAVQNVMDRRSDVLEQDADEQYMDSFEEDVLESDPDEPYMDLMDDASDRTEVQREHAMPTPVKSRRRRRTADEVVDYEIESHGVNNASYFRGCGTALSDWEDVATGIGWTEHEAVEDALDQLAQSGWNVRNIQNRADKRKTVEDVLGDEMFPEDDLEAALEDSYFYVCVYVR